MPNTNTAPVYSFEISSHREPISMREYAAGFRAFMMRETKLGPIVAATSPFFFTRAEAEAWVASK